MMVAQPTYAIPCRVEVLHDADSLVVTLLCPRGVRVEHVRVRAYGWDAWEVDRTRRTVHPLDVELALGRRARDAFADLLKVGTLWVEDAKLVVAHVKEDPYGRWLAVLWVRMKDGSWIDVGEWAEENGHLREPRHAG